jgi:hypothetical protein
MYRVPQRREAASWKSWGGVQSEEAAAEEATRIAQELRALAAEAGFGLEVRPVVKVSSPEAAARLDETEADVRLIYPATGPGDLLRALMPQKRYGVIFVRRRSGPIYY